MDRNVHYISIMLNTSPVLHKTCKLFHPHVSTIQLQQNLIHHRQGVFDLTMGLVCVSFSGPTLLDSYMYTTIVHVDSNAQVLLYTCSQQHSRNESLAKRSATTMLFNPYVRNLVTKRKSALGGN